MTKPDKPNSDELRERLDAALCENERLREEIVALRGSQTELGSAQHSLEKAARELDLHRYIVDKAASAVYLINEAGVLIYVNECAAHYAGYFREELQGKQVSILDPGMTPDLWSERWKRVEAVEAGKMDVTTRDHRRKDGSVYRVEILAHHIRFEGETYQLSLGLDITDRARTERELARKAALADHALRLTRAGHWHARLDDTGNYTSSERLAAIFGDPPIPGHVYPIPHWLSCIEAVDPEIAAATVDKFVNACKGLTPMYEAVYPYKRPADGRVVWAHALGMVVHDPNETFPEMYGVVQDITDIVEARRATEAARAAAESANRAKSAFLANMSHELRTPLNAILGYSQMMLRDRDKDSPDAGTLRIINNSGEHLLALINSVLDLAKIEAHKYTLEPVEFDLGQFLNELAEILRRRAEDKGLNLAIDQSSSFPRCVRADRDKLRQVLINIVGNAIKFTATGGVTLRLTTRGQLRDDGTGELSFEIADTGPGIHPEDIERIFEPFAQAAHRPKAEGTGLGLALAREFVRLMGGDIRVTSEYGAGSVFAFHIAYTPVDDAGLARLMAPPQGETVAIEGAAGLRVLIVEDHLENRMLLRRLLASLGFEIAEAENGAVGVELAAQWKPDLVLMDRRMPVMDGVTATLRIRELPDSSRIRVVAVTAEAFREDYESMMEAGCDAFIRKPYKLEEILVTMATFLPVKLVRAAPEGVAVAGSSLVDETATREQLARLPAAEIAALRAACDAADSETASEIIARHPELESTAVSTLMQSYRLDLLSRLLPET